MLRPELVRVELGGLAFWTDEALAEQGVRVAFSERSGGVSSLPFDSLNLAAHVGDDPSSVDENRSRFMYSVGVSELRDRLITADQVHGITVATVDMSDAGRGALATEMLLPGTSSPVPATDGLVATATNLPLMLFFADCVPVVLAVTDPVPGIAIVHAGWRGALERIPEKGVEALLAATGAQASQVMAYVGPHIGGCCYKVSKNLIARFNSSFDKIAAVDDRLDLVFAVRSSLQSAGLAEAQIAEIGSCTYDSVDRFFSYRASNVTGRHGALAVITKE